MITSFFNRMVDLGWYADGWDWNEGDGICSSDMCDDRICSGDMCDDDNPDRDAHEPDSDTDEPGSRFETDDERQRGQPHFPSGPADISSVRRPPRDSGVPIIQRVFTALNGREPGVEALIRASALFGFKEELTRADKRSRGLIWNVIERHGPEILAALQDERIAFQLCAILINGTKRPTAKANTWHSFSIHCRPRH
jgi:hypothetical protein